MTKPDSPLAPAVAGAAIHTAFYLAAYLTFSAALDGVRSAYADLGLQQPELSAALLRGHAIAGNDPPFAVAGLVVFAAADGFLLYWLGHPGRWRRTARELWSGLVVAGPVAVALLTAAAVAQPMLALTRALTTPFADTRADARQREVDALGGTWRTDAGDTLTIRVGKGGAAGYTWRGGTGSVVINRLQNPTGVSLYDAAAINDAAKSRHGLVRREGDKLRLALGRPGAVGADLPTGFDDKRPGVEHLVFEIVR